MSTSYCGRHLRKVLAQIDGLTKPVAGKFSIENRERFYASSQTIQRRPVSTALTANIKANEGGNQLQVVLYSMLQFLKQQILIAQLSLEFLSLRFGTLGNVNHRNNAIVFRFVLVLDHAGKCVYQQTLRLFALKCPDKIVAINQSLGEGGQPRTFTACPLSTRLRMFGRISYSSSATLRWLVS